MPLDYAYRQLVGTPRPFCVGKDWFIVSEVRSWPWSGHVVLLGKDLGGGSACPDWGMGVAIPRIHSKLLEPITDATFADIARWRSHQCSDREALAHRPSADWLKAILRAVALELNSEKAPSLTFAIGKPGFPFQFDLAILVASETHLVFFHSGSYRIHMVADGKRTLLSTATTLADVSKDPAHAGIVISLFGFTDEKSAGHCDEIPIPDDCILVIAGSDLDEAISKVGAPEEWSREPSELAATISAHWHRRKSDRPVQPFMVVRHRRALATSTAGHR